MLVVIFWCQITLLLARLVQATVSPRFTHLSTSRAQLYQQLIYNKSFSSALTNHESALLSNYLSAANRHRKLLEYVAELENTAMSPSLLFDLEQTPPLDSRAEAPVSTRQSFSASSFINPQSSAATESPKNITIPSLSEVSNGELAFRILGAVFCTLVILCTIVGNVLVIIVVFKFHRMRTVTNILLAR